jgi:hypothetical protein
MPECVLDRSVDYGRDVLGSFNYPSSAREDFAEVYGAWQLTRGAGENDRSFETGHRLLNIELDS